MTGVARDSLMDPRDNHRMFDRIAPRYDLLNRLMSFGLDRYWRRRAIDALSPYGNGHVLDIGCGTGDVTLDLLRRNPDATVTGIDLSQPMLNLAVAKAGRAGLSARATFQAGDATALPFGPGAFDAVVCAFCFRNIAHHGSALAEMRRVLRPGGSLVILELTAPTCPIMRLVHGLYTHAVVPLLGRCLSLGSAYRYLAESIDHFPPAGQVVELMRQTGFEAAACHSLSGGVVTVFAARKPAGGCGT
jgi:demethylmenaquinone methyltransferase/2-methoxy-6-polyprenyl-1,4-benzoquinol methylase